MSTLEAPKRDWVTIVVTVVTALVGTTIFGPLINSLISEMSKPYVQILMESNEDGRNASFFLSNTGGTAATHLKFLVQTPQKVVRFTNLSTENTTLTHPNSTIIEANLKRLAQGKGSFVSVNLTMAAPTKNYHAFATYDQGSAKGSFSLQPRISDWYWLFIIIAALYGIGVFILARWTWRRYKKHRQGRLMFNLSSEIAYILGKPPIQRLRDLQHIRQLTDYELNSGRLDNATYQLMIARIEEIEEDTRKGL